MDLLFRSNTSTSAVRLVLTTLLVMAGVAQGATVLDFTGQGGNLTLIPQSYGDNLAGTPNVTVGYRVGSIATNVTTFSDLTNWSTGYGDLVNVAFGGRFGDYAEIALTAGGGQNVRLNSFDLASFGSTQALQTVNVLVDGLSSFNFIGSILGGSSRSSFSPNLTGQTVTIRFGYNNENIGIDNISFDQLAPVSNNVVPEPSAILLSLTGLAAVALRCRRSAR